MGVGQGSGSEVWLWSWDWNISMKGLIGTQMSVCDSFMDSGIGLSNLPGPELTSVLKP